MPDTLVSSLPITSDRHGSAEVSDIHRGEPAIIDIRRELDQSSLVEEIFKGLNPPDGEAKTLPTLLLYDEKGLKLFEKITYLDQYYLTGAEIEILETYADRIAERIPDNSVLVELGSGNLRKISIILHAIDRSGKRVEYYALDLDLLELQRTLSAVPKGTFKHVKCFGLHGTYDDGLEWMKRSEIAAKPKTVFSMGSSIGNFTPDEALGFLDAYSKRLGKGDLLIIGIDACNDPDKVYHAYNDREGVTHQFIANGLTHANRVLGRDAFAPDDWKVIGAFNKEEGCHQAFVSPTKDVTIGDTLVREGERIRFEHSYKYPEGQTAQVWDTLGLTEAANWQNKDGDYGLHMLVKPKFTFPTSPGRYAADPVPSLSDWHGLWAAWDSVTQGMISEDALYTKPIQLRNECIFYLGHIPTFLDIQLTRATNDPPTGPKTFVQMFERGIDPDVDHPEICHPHSEQPEAWPPVGEILGFQDRVRARVRKLLDRDTTRTNERVRRALWLGFEHEAMHLETLLYMLLQSDLTLPPPGTIRPDFEALARAARQAAVENCWFNIPAMDVKIGMDDDENEDGPTRYYGWDSEKPSRTVRVEPFKAKARPITNGEYAIYLQQTSGRQIPASWLRNIEGEKAPLQNGFHKPANGVLNSDIKGRVAARDDFIRGKAVRTVYGPVPLGYALDWPVFASFEELSGCASWMGGRIPKLEEVRSIHAYSEILKAKDIRQAHNNTIPAVNGHLVNNGVQETPPSRSSVLASGAAAGPNPHDLFVDLAGANIGFKHWHPMPVTPHGDKLAGQAEMGGVWEWTSTVLEKHEGFTPMPSYPGYTADFFDAKHNIVVGGSWSTHPRIAGRKSFVNWYQRNYAYPWAGARLVRDD